MATLRGGRSGHVLAWQLAGAAVTIGLVAIGLWWATHRESAPHYIAVPITRGAIERRITATGTVNPVLTIIIGSYVSGVISSMSCDYNTRVHKGQLCAKIDPRPYQAALDLAQGQLKRDSAQLEGARIDLQRYEASLARNAIAKQIYDDQLALVHQLEGSVQVDRAAVDSARVNLEYTDIVSPVDGTVVSRNVTQGQTVASSFQTPTLFLIATDLKQMQVDTNTSEGDIGEVKEGDKATFTVDAFPKRIFAGVVSQVRQSPQTVQNVVTYDAVVSVDNSDLALKPGMTASTQIVVDQRNDVLRVPNQALRFAPSGVVAAAPQGAPAGDRARLWVLRDGKPVAVEVVTGLDDSNFTEIVSGDLREGDSVITAEARSDARGQPVLPQPRL